MSVHERTVPDWVLDRLCDCWLLQHCCTSPDCDCGEILAAVKATPDLEGEATP